MGGVIGGVVGVALLLGLGYLLGRRNRAQKRSSEKELGLEPVRQSKLSTAAGQSSPVFEVENTKPRSELDGLAPTGLAIAELPASQEMGGRRVR